MIPVRKKRKKTALELAKHFGVCERTIRNHVAEDRNFYEKRAMERRKIAASMHEAGKSWDEIAAAVNGSEEAAKSLVKRYRVKKSQEQEQKQCSGLRPS